MSEAPNIPPMESENARTVRQLLPTIPGATPVAKARWLALAALEELPEGNDVTLHLESIIKVLEGED